MNQTYEPAAHYDRVTEAWDLLLGAELHWGFFRTGTEPLDVATAALTTLMIERAEFSPGMRLLDFGCGTGTPALRVAQECGVEVLGITTSAVGVAAAKQRAADAGVDTVDFELRDGMNTGLPSESFDRAWALESSHLMPDRAALLSEAGRVLKPGGRFVLCDIIRLRDVPFAELRASLADYAVLRAAFGEARMDRLEQYAEHAGAAGLVPGETLNVTSEALPTLDRWQDNLDSNRAEVESLIGVEGADAFGGSLEVMRRLWGEGTFGYGLMVATKP